MMIRCLVILQLVQSLLLPQDRLLPVGVGVWNLFCKLVLDGKEMPESVFENNFEEFCRGFIDGLYKKAEATVKRENQSCRS